MAAAGAKRLGLRSGLVVGAEAARGAEQAPPLPSGFEVIVGGHPVPNARSEEAGRNALARAEALTPDDTLIVLISGGASALMAVPAEGVTLDDKRATTDRLLRSGADIYALNTVRKHLSAIKGGWLAARTRAACIALAISDVVGDDLSVIASGPTVADASTFQDALDILQRFGGEKAYPAGVVSRLRAGARGSIAETPKPGDPRVGRAATQLIGSRRDAMRGAADHASALGYQVISIDAAVTGEARTASRSHLHAALARAAGIARPSCIISSGETIVNVTGSGKGGRNQEFALAAVAPLAQTGASAALASVGTDGIDGPTDAAGAIVDQTTRSRAAAAGLDPARFLSNNDAYAFFDALGDLIRTGPTATNVGDLQVILLA
jgi:hydroxypyruvate reductase